MLSGGEHMLDFSTPFDFCDTFRSGMTANCRFFIKEALKKLNDLVRAIFSHLEQFLEVGVVSEAVGYKVIKQSPVLIASILQSVT